MPKGRIDCHISLIKESYRTRGKQLRINNIKPIRYKLINPISPNTIKSVIIAITEIIPYSLKKIRTNMDLPISTLKPLISSLSPSKRSKGARLLSINESKIHIIIHVNNDSLLKKILLERENPFNLSKEIRKTMIKATSNESLCNIPRIAPSLENLLVTLHPDIITP